MGQKTFGARLTDRVCLVFVLAWMSCTTSSATAGDDARPMFRLSSDAVADQADRDQSSEAKPWHIDFGVRSSCTRLAETKKILDQRLDIPLRYDYLNLFDDPETPIDLKSDFKLTTFYLGAGRQESDWFIWTLYAGGGFGKQHDHQRVGVNNLEVNFKYAYVFTGVTAEVYPWKTPKLADFEDWEQRLAASRPFLATSFETGYVSAEGRGNWKIAPLPRIYQDKDQVRDWVASVNFGLGWHLPISLRWSFVLMGDYRFHFYRSDEYNGWTVTTAVRYDLP